ncbi:MAG: hypothetical protein ACRDLC_01165 [Actinomycetota bacterium]
MRTTTRGSLAVVAAAVAAADTFAQVAGRLTDVDSVVRVEVPGRPSLYLFEVRRRG